MSYWQDRQANAQTKLTNKNIKQIEKQLGKYYARAMENVITEFENTHNRLIATLQNGVEPTPADLYKLDKYWKLQGQLQEELQKLGNKQVKAMAKTFELNFFDIYYSINIEGAEVFSTLDSEAVQHLINDIWVADGKSWSQRIWDNTEKLAATLNDELINCVATGQDVSYLRTRLQERFNVSYSAADSLARTELAHIQTQAAKKRYEDYGIKEVEVWADEDERRCDICGKLHQKKYPVGAVMPIPAHPRCRCTIIPVID